MIASAPQFRPPPEALARCILDHQRWLSSNGRFGKRLQCEGRLFKDTDLEGMDLSHACLNSAYFKGGSVKGARFIEAELGSAIFEACDVNGADFTRAHLARSIFATNHDKACFAGASREHMTFGINAGVEEAVRNAYSLGRRVIREYRARFSAHAP
jgi:hypothetical protein